MKRKKLTTCKKFLTYLGINESSGNRLHVPTVMFYLAVATLGVPFVTQAWSAGFMIASVLVWALDRILQHNLAVVKALDEHDVRRWIGMGTDEYEKEMDEKFEAVVTQMNETTLKVSDLTNRLNTTQSKQVMG